MKHGDVLSEIFKKEDFPQKGMVKSFQIIFLQMIMKSYGMIDLQETGSGGNLNLEVNGELIKKNYWPLNKSKKDY